MDIHSPTPNQWQELVAPCWNRLMKRNLKETELRVAWYVLACSFVIGRQDTGSMLLKEIALCCGISTGAASTTLKSLKGMRVIQPNTTGDGWQFMPESDREEGHHWITYDRLVDPSTRLIADHLERAHKRSVGEMSLPGIEDPTLEREVAALMAKETKGGRQTTERKEKGVFLPKEVPESGTQVSPASSKSFARSTERSLTLDTLRGNEVPESGTAVVSKALDCTEAGMGWEEDRNSIEEKVLIYRLVAKLGKDLMEDKGRLWRAFIRGSKDAGDDPTTAEAVREALNELRYREQTNKPVKDKAKFLYSYARAYAAAHGWEYRIGLDSKGAWQQVTPFNWWERYNVRRRRK